MLYHEENQPNINKIILLNKKIIKIENMATLEATRSATEKHGEMKQILDFKNYVCSK